MTAAVLTACPLCEHSEAAVYLEGEGEALDASMIGPSRGIVSPGRILRCRGCGFGYRQTRFSEQKLAEMYGAMDPHLYQAEMEGRRRTAQRRLEVVRRHVHGRRLLDVGCASGVFLELAAEAGWDATGVEPSAALCRQASKALAGKGSALCTTLECAPLAAAFFDAITIWDVLEHVPDPLAMLRKCRLLLRPGGFLFVNVPDLDSIEARILGRRWPLVLAEHLNYFNRPSLDLAGRKTGLTLVRFGRLRACFSLRYVFHRLEQHRIPGASLGRRLAQSAAGRLLIPVSLGETYAVWRS
jgi:SAM-dependent methyltransferase